MSADYINQFLFQFYPYITLVVFVVGSALRYDRDQYSWKADSSQLLRKKGMRLGNNLFHIGIIGLLFGHAVGLLTPSWIYHYVITTETKQLIAMSVGGFFGALTFVGMSILIYRRLFDARIRATSKPADIMILLVLYAQLILGLISIFYSAKDLEGNTMTAMGNWAQHIVTFRGGAADFVMQAPLIFKLHLVLGMSLFLLFPFTRLVHVFSGFAAPIKYLWRTGYQIVRKRG
ncbi:MAG: respiratory nitrate reductase subunit gamma [Devosiaceae bacterium]|nr:respiratory nitrate reductase subunit gamma [Devosiaceae bacterium]